MLQRPTTVLVRGSGIGPPLLASLVWPAWSRPISPARAK